MTTTVQAPVDLSDPRWGCACLDEPSRLHTQVRVESLLGMPLRPSPGGTGLWCLRESLKRKGAVVPSPLAEKDIRPLATSLCFMRPDALGSRRHVWMVDRVGAYLNAAHSGRFGLADMEHTATPDDPWRQYGIWRIRGWSIHESRAHLLGLPTLVRRAWVSSAMLAHLEQIGARYYVEEGYVWRSRHELLRDWAEKMIDCRLAGGDVAACGKRIANATIGMFSHRSRFHDVPPWWYRPDWRATIQQTNLLTTARKILTLEGQGYAVLSAYEDMLLVAGDDDVPPEALLARQTRIGGWRVQREWHGQEAHIPVNLMRKAPSVSAWLGTVHS